MLSLLMMCLTYTTYGEAYIGDVTAAARLVVSLRNFLSYDSVTVLRSGDETGHEDQILVKLMKYVASSDVPIATVDLRRETTLSSSALNVLTTTDDKIKDFINSIARRMPGASRWLLFLDPRDDLEEVFGNVFLPLHCQFLVSSYWGHHRVFTLVEVYRRAPGRPLHRLHVGTWSPDLGLTTPPSDFFFRRRSLHGVLIKGGTTSSTSISSLKANKDVLNGFDGQAWSLLQEFLNFSTEVKVSPEPFGGSRLNNGSWSGLVGLLQRQEIQVTIDLILMSSRRAQVVDYSVPLLQIHDDIFVRYALHNAVDWRSFLAPFSARLWFALLTTTCTMALTLYTICHEMASTPPSWYKLLFYVQGALVQQGQAPLSSSVPFRIAYVTCYLTGTIILGAYSAFVISSLTLRTPELPFTSLEELLHSRTYRFATQVPSGEFSLFQEASEGVLKDAYAQLLLPDLQDLPGSEVEGLRRVCERHNYAFFTSTEYILVHLNDLTCAVTKLPRHVFVFHVGLGFPKGSPYIGIFNYAIQRIQETGLLHRLKNHALSHFPQKLPEPYVPVEMRNVVPIFAFLACSMTLSLVVLVLELVWFHYHLAPCDFL